MLMGVRDWEIACQSPNLLLPILLKVGRKNAVQLLNICLIGPAELAATENTGARGLMTICERVFRDFKFKLPSTRVRRLVVTEALVDDPRRALQQLLGKGNAAEK